MTPTLPDSETRKMPKKRYLIAARDISLVEHPLVIVLAYSDSEAIRIYLQQIESKESVFRDWVLDLAPNMSFAETFYLTTDLEHERLVRSGITGTEPEIVRSRVRSYFGDRSDLCDEYLSFMDTEDQDILSDEIFEFIAMNQGPDEHGLVAFDIDAIAVIE